MRTKNILATLMQSIFALGLVSVLWVVIGYTLAFGPDKGHLIGGLDFMGFSGVGQEPNPELAATIPHQAFAVFQMRFRNHHAGVDYRRLCRAHEILGLRSIHRTVADTRLLASGALGLGAWRMDPRASALSISPAEPWFT